MATQYSLFGKVPSDGQEYTFHVYTPTSKLTLNAVATKKEGPGMGHSLKDFAREFAHRVEIYTWTITNTSDNSKVGELTYDGIVANLSLDS